MPRSLPRCSVKSHISSLISPKTDSIREFKANRKLKRNSNNNITKGNSSKVLHSFNVTEPSNFEAGSYYHFYCDSHEPNKLSKTQFQTRNFKREAKQKRYPDLGLRDESPLPSKLSGLVYEPPAQPYCFRKSSFFPEVEYPLSARDMWIPKYWSRLLDAEVPRNVKPNTLINQNEQQNIESIYQSYENSPLYDIIKTLNNNKKVDTDIVNHSTSEETVPPERVEKSKHYDTYPYQSPTPTIDFPEDTVSSKQTTSDFHSGILPYTKTTIEVYPVPQTASASSIVQPETIATPMVPNRPATIATDTGFDLRNADFDIIGSATTLPSDYSTSPIIKSLDDNFISPPPTNGSVQTQELVTFLSETNIESSAKPELSLNSSTEKIPEQLLRYQATSMQSTTLSPMKNSNEIRSEFDKIGFSTVSPFDLFTSPIIKSIASTDNFISFPTTIASVQAQEQEVSVLKSSIEPTATTEQVSFISSTQIKPELQIRDYTIPIQSTTLSPIKSSDLINSSFDAIGDSTASSPDLFTLPIIQSLVSEDNLTPLPTTIASMNPSQEREVSLSKMNIETTVTPEPVSLTTSMEKKPEQQLKDYTTSTQSTTLTPLRSSKTIHSDFDKIRVSTVSPSDLITSSITQSTDNFISLPTTIVSTQVQKQEASQYETNIEPTVTPELVSFISLTEQKTDNESQPKISLNTNFDKTHVSTASPFDVFTSSMTHSDTLLDSSFSHTQSEEIPATLFIATSTGDGEVELRFDETDTKSTTNSPLLSFAVTLGNKTEEKIMDYTILMRSTPSLEYYSDDKASLTDSISLVSNGSDLILNVNVTLENTNIINDDLNTDESFLKQDVVKNDVDVKQPNISSSSKGTQSGHALQTEDVLLSANVSFPVNPDQLNTFQGQVVGYYYENSTIDDILHFSTSPHSNSSIIFTEDFKDNWVYSPNDSYITWESIPECSDECFIFIDTEHSAPSTVICNDNNLKISSKPEMPLTKEPKFSEDVTKTRIPIPENTIVTERNQSEEMPKIVLTPNLSHISDNTEAKPVQSSQENGTTKYPVDNKIPMLDRIGILADFVSASDIADSTILKSPLLSEHLKDSIFDVVNDIRNSTTVGSQDIVNYLMRKSNIDEIILSAGNDTNDVIIYVEDMNYMNSTSDNIYVDVDDDETWASYTEIPYDSLVLYPEEENDTWIANGNEYTLLQQMPSEDSDDTTHIFLDSEKLSGLLNEIILSSN